MRLPPPVGRLGRPFGCLWGSYTLANLSDGLVFVGFPLVAVHLTRSPVLVAGTMVALTLPWFLFGLVAGALVDRLDRRALMVYASVPRVAVLTLLAVAALSGALTLPLLYAGAFVLGTAEVLFDSSGQALLPMLVDRDSLRQANGRLFGTGIVMNDFVGAPLAGLLVSLTVAGAFLAPAALYLAAPLALLLIRGRVRPNREAVSTIWADIGSGLAELGRNAPVRTLAVFAGLANLSDEAFYAVLVLYVVGAGSVLHLPEPAYGLLLAVGAGGATIGSFALDSLGRLLRTKALLVAGSVGTAISFAVPALFPNRFAVAAALFVGGLSLAVLGVLTVSLRQELVAEDMLGRIGAAYRLIAFGTRPLGAGLAGVIATAIGLRSLFLLCAATILLVIPLIVRLRLPARGSP